MKYLCLAYEEESKLNALSPNEWDALRQETLSYVDSLRSRGCLLAAEALQSIRTAVTVRVRDGNAVRSDGPFAETKEQLGGIVLIEAAGMEEAIRIAEGWPSARLGSIEVRPIEPHLREESRYL
jgi:hypothetical protein